MDLLSLPLEILQDTVSKLDYNSIINLCEAYPDLKVGICEDPVFWRAKAKRDLANFTELQLQVFESFNPLLRESSMKFYNSINDPKFWKNIAVLEFPEYEEYIQYLISSDSGKDAMVSYELFKKIINPETTSKKLIDGLVRGAFRKIESKLSVGDKDITHELRMVFSLMKIAPLGILSHYYRRARIRNIKKILSVHGLKFGIK